MESIQKWISVKPKRKSQGKRQIVSSVHQPSVSSLAHTFLRMHLSLTVYNPMALTSDAVLQGYGQKMGSTAGLFSKWERKYIMLYPNRLEWAEGFQVQVQGSKKRGQGVKLRYTCSQLPDSSQHVFIAPSHSLSLSSFECVLFQSPKAQVLTFDAPTLVEEKENKGSKVLRVQAVGSKKEHCLRFDVSRKRDA